MTAADSARLVPTRDAILNAAEALFAAHGYGGTSLQQIGEAATLSRGTPGYFFKTKERLYHAVIQRLLDQARVALAPAYGRLEDDANGLDRLVYDLVQAHFEFLASKPAFVRLLQREALGAGAVFEQLREPAARLTQLLGELSRRYGSTPLSPAEAAALTTNVAALCAFPLTYAEPLAGTLGVDPSSPAFAEAQVRTVTDLIVRQLLA
jgi:TetR/AcrR family transcriptional regulator